ncbi:hypothetical protein D050_4402 [Vibrio parahaemolyticus VPCR-2009]|nr:hypothetical protein D050_4402 [Vibrio parahaemolyticus VPCR-2009]
MTLMSGRCCAQYSLIKLAFIESGELLKPWMYNRSEGLLIEVSHEKASPNLELGHH